MFLTTSTLLEQGTAMFSVDGLISGLDTATIVEGALSLQQSRIDRLSLRKQEVTDEKTVFKTIEGQLLGLQGPQAVYQYTAVCRLDLTNLQFQIFHLYQKSLTDVTVAKFALVKPTFCLQSAPVQVAVLR